MDKWRTGTFKFSELNKDPVPIVSDAAMANVCIADGRFVPVLIVDTTNRPDVDDLVKIHEYTSSGDVKCTWGSHEWGKRQTPFKQLTKVALFLEFERPSEALVILEFDVVKLGVIVNAIMESKAIYLQPGKKGDRLKHDINKSKVLVEIPDTGFRKVWNKLWHKNLVKKFKKDGLNRSSAIKAATESINQIIKMYEYRMRQEA